MFARRGGTRRNASGEAGASGADGATTGATENRTARWGAAEPLPPAKLRLKAIAMLARREHSRSELRGKLRRFNSDAAVIDEVLDLLQAGDYLSDERTAASISRVRGARYGSLRVANDLRSKGIGGELATATLAALKSTEAERAQALWQNKFGEPPADADERARQMRFLQARGFASELIRKTVPATRKLGSSDD